MAKQHSIRSLLHAAMGEEAPEIEEEEVKEIESRQILSEEEDEHETQQTEDGEIDSDVDDVVRFATTL